MLSHRSALLVLTLTTITATTTITLTDPVGPAQQFMRFCQLAWKGSYSVVRVWCVVELASVLASLCLSLSIHTPMHAFIYAFSH